MQLLHYLVFRWSNRNRWLLHSHCGQDMWKVWLALIHILWPGPVSPTEDGGKRSVERLTMFLRCWSCMQCVSWLRYFPLFFKFLHPFTPFSCLLAPSPPAFPYCSASFYLIGSYVLFTPFLKKKVQCLVESVYLNICDIYVSIWELVSSDNWQLSFMKRLLDLTPTDSDWNILLRGLCASKRFFFSCT